MQKNLTSYRLDTPFVISTALVIIYWIYWHLTALFSRQNISILFCELYNIQKIIFDVFHLTYNCGYQMRTWYFLVSINQRSRSMKYNEKRIMENALGDSRLTFSFLCIINLYTKCGNHWPQISAYRFIFCEIRMNTDTKLYYNKRMNHMIAIYTTIYST